MRVGVAHPGPQHAGQTALALQEAGQLGWFATSFYYKASAWPDRALAALPPALRRRAERELGRRRQEGLDEALVRRWLETDLYERMARPLLSPKARQRLQHRRGRRFPARLLALCEREPVDVLWAPPACLPAFRALKPRGVRCVLDHTSGHPAARDAAMRAEYARHPEFFPAEPMWLRADELADHREAIDLADLVVVGSDFAARTFIEHGADRAKLRVIPYGYDERLFPAAQPQRPPARGRPLECVYVGRVSAMKGASSLLEAFSRLDPAIARLTLVGSRDLPSDTLARHAGFVRLAGQVPHGDVPAMMSRADVFIFPSLFEGGGIVLYEAAACGLGIIQTDACGDGVRGDNGRVVPAGSADALAAAIEAAAADGAPQRWGDASWAMRGERGWARYRTAVAATLRELAGA